MTNDLREAFDPVADALESLGIRYRIGGSVASATMGVSRSTLDIDIVVDIGPAQMGEFVRSLDGAYYVDAESIHDAIRRRRSFSLIHLTTMMKVDVFVLGTRPFDRAAFERRDLRSLTGTAGRTFPVTTAEDMIVRKLEWYENGGQVSERQWGDVLGVLRIQKDSLDLDYLEHWARALGLDQLLERALEEAGGRE